MPTSRKRAPKTKTRPAPAQTSRVPTQSVGGSGWAELQRRAWRNPLRRPDQPMPGQIVRLAGGVAVGLSVNY